MKRLMLALIALVALAAAPAAHADGSPWPTGKHSFVYGKIVSVDTTAGTITADVRVPPVLPSVKPPEPPTPPTAPTPPTDGTQPTEPPFKPGAPSERMPPPNWGPGSSPMAIRAELPPVTMPTAQRVTITTDANTIVRLDDQAASLSQLATGDEFIAGFNAAPGSSLDQIIAGPAVGISAHTPRVFYGFVGSVTSVDKTAHTLTINVLGESPSARALGVQNGQSLTLTVGDKTIVLALPNGFAHGASVLDSVTTGDIVAGGYLAPAKETLTALLAVPLNVLIDIPLGSLPSGSPGSGSVTRAQSRALKLAANLVHGKRGGNHGGKGKHHSSTHSGVK